MLPTFQLDDLVLLRANEAKSWGTSSYSYDLLAILQTRSDLSKWPMLAARGTILNAKKKVLC